MNEDEDTVDINAEFDEWQYELSLREKKLRLLVDFNSQAESFDELVGMLKEMNDLNLIDDIPN